MAPTELLAEQHCAQFDALVRAARHAVALLTGSQPRARAGAARSQRIAARRRSRWWSARTRCSRRAWSSASWRWSIVDEQHRFGVQQRLQLREKGGAARMPHQLIMTATPIPRTLAMTAYADLDVSVIDELPPGRTPVRTVVVPEERRAEVVARIDETCRDGRQAYWVCPLIEESEELRCQAAEESAALLTEALPERARRPGARPHDGRATRTR